MVMDDFVALIESKGLLSGSHNVSRMTVKEAYVWSQRRTTSTHAKVEHEEKSLQRMDFYEFLEALALMAVRMHSDPFQHGKMPLHEKLQILIDHLLGRGPSEEEMELKKEAMKLGFDSGTQVDIWWEKKQRSYEAIILGVDGEKLKIVVQYLIDESIAFYTLDDLFDKVMEAKQNAEGRYVTLQDIQAGYEDYNGLKKACPFLLLAILIWLTTWIGIRDASIKIKGELFEVMKARSDGPNTPLAFTAESYEDIQEVYTTIIDDLEKMQINSTIKDGSIVLVSAALRFQQFQEFNKETNKTCGLLNFDRDSQEAIGGMPKVYANFSYDIDKLPKDCGHKVELPIYIFRTKGLRNEQKKLCAAVAVALKNKCTDNHKCYDYTNLDLGEHAHEYNGISETYCDSYGDWNGTLNGTSLNTANKKLTYLMAQENKIAFQSEEITLSVGFYHPQSGYFFSMELGYKRVRSGRYELDTTRQSRAAPVSISISEALHVLLNFITLIFTSIYICKSAFLLVNYARCKKKTGIINTSSEDCVFEFFELAAGVLTFASCLSYASFVDRSFSRTLENSDRELTQDYSNSKNVGSVALILWLIVLFGKLRFQ
eukprot:g2883.t1